jgi:hypothetical protein
MTARTTRKRGAVELNNVDSQPVKRSKKRPSEESIEAVSSGGPVKSTATDMQSSASPDVAPPQPALSGQSANTDKPVVVHEESDSSDYETIKVLKGHPSRRDLSELPIIAEHYKTRERKVLWAKMDTGADVNVIAAKTVQRLGLSSKITDSHIDLGEIGGNKVEIDRKVAISFWAGRKHHFCEKVEFFIPKEVQDTDTDGLPDVVLGLHELKKRHMIMIDPDFANEPEEGLEVIARRAAEEVEGDLPPAIFLGKKYPQVPKK